jgi:TetR/AcrR family transcriptional regulator
MNIKDDKDKERAIINAATELFLDKGFASTSTTEIAKRVGCNQALVHYYFRTKERLFEAVFAEKFKSFVTNILEISQGNFTFEEKLRLKIESHFDMLQDNPKLPLLIVYELNTNPKRLESMKEHLGDLPTKVFANFQVELDTEIEKGNIREIKVIDLIFNIISLNLSMFIIGPILKSFAGLSKVGYENLVNQRKKENVNTILKSLRP